MGSPSAAGGAIVGTSRFLPPEGTVFYWLLVSAGGGEVNTITVTALGNGFAVRDGTAAVQVADPNCAAVSLHEARCFPPTRFDRVQVALGDRDDTALVTAPVATEFSGGPGNDRVRYEGAFGALMRGDAGNDVLEGGDGPDQLLGGAGADAMRGAGGHDQLHLDGEVPDDDLADGGAGNDGVIYDIRRNVVVDLAAGVGGGPGERDRFTGIEGVGTVGGDDLITGSGRADRITTGAGNDRISAGAGDDHIDSGPGRDQVSAGPGVDVINPGRAPFQFPADLLLVPGDVVRCGTGRDSIESVAPRDLLGRDCESLTDLRTVAGNIRTRPVRFTRRSITFRVPCKRPPDAVCAGTVALADRRARHIGRRAFRARPRRHRDARVKLTASGRRLLRRAGGATTRVTLSYARGGGLAGSYDISWSIKLRIPQ